MDSATSVQRARREIGARIASSGGTRRAGRRLGSIDEPGVVEPGVVEPGVVEPGVVEPGVPESGVAEPGVDRSGRVRSSEAVVIGYSSSTAWTNLGSNSPSRDGLLG